METGRLTIVALVLRAQPAVASLTHVADVLSAFLGPSPHLTLARAVSFDSLKLLDLVWASSCVSIDDSNSWYAWSLLNFLRSDRYYYRYSFSKALEEAARLGLLHVVEWLFAHFSGVEAEIEVVEAAANAGHLHILQYLFDHGTFAEYQVVEYEAEFLGPRRQYPDEGIVIRWGRDDAVIATNSCHGEVVRWLYEHTARANGSRDMPLLMMSTFNVGDLPLAEWLMAHGCPFSAHDALMTRRADVGQWLLRRGDLEPGTTMIERKAFVIWASRGHLELMQLLVKSHAPFIHPTSIWSALWQEAMEVACQQCHLPVVRWLLEHSMGCTLLENAHGSIHSAAVNGHLELVQLLHSHGYSGCTARTMYYAAGAGKLPMVQWIHAHFAEESRIGLFPKVEGSSTRIVAADEVSSAMDRAAINGRLEVLQFLHGLDAPAPVQPRGHNRGKGSSEPKQNGRRPWATHAAMDGAAANGHLEVVQWLHANRTEGCTTAAMDGAAVSGHLHVVQWLHANRSEGCTTLAMDGAATNGHLEVVQWLHANMSTGCTSGAMSVAASDGHLEVVKWLHANRSEGCSIKAMDDAATHGHLKVVQWLYANRFEGCTDDALVGAIECDHLRVAHWLLMTPIIDEVPSDMCMAYSNKNSFETLLFMHWFDTPTFCSDDLTTVVEQFNGASDFILDWLVQRYREEEEFW
ncbi:hypothetical protein BBJ28_00013362 [Nothophytophthora sp. Chile5]|nr:hypothetical protein BBJ28_00013362 [Nothophytophthora sp. Chile5]